MWHLHHTQKNRSTLIQKIGDSFFSLVDTYMHAQYGTRKKVLLKDHPDEILEIGAGYGANFRYLRRGTKVIAIEPNSSLHGLLERRAMKFGIELEIHSVGAENINLADGSVEFVLSTLVLCSVEDSSKVLSEIERVLNPTGIFAYIEHVKAHEHSWICSVQKLVKKPWKWFFDGCHVTRDTSALIRQAGFSSVEEEAFSNRTIFVPMIPHIAGVAQK